MLRNDLVPEALRTTVMDHVVAKISEDSSMREPYPDDLLEELQRYFGVHLETYRAIVETARGYHFDYQYFEKLMDPTWVSNNQ
jgi:hypothetical protein